MFKTWGENFLEITLIFLYSYLVLRMEIKFHFEFKLSYNLFRKHFKHKCKEKSMAKDCITK